MLSNPTIIGWVERSLVRAGAALRCEQHGGLRSTGDDAAARNAVIVGQLARFDDLSPDAIELIFLEKYISLSSECPDCDGSGQLNYVSPDQRFNKG